MSVSPLHPYCGRFGHLVKELQVGALRDKLEGFAQAVSSRGSKLPNCWAFVDGTVRQIARPGVAQRVMYNGKDRVHAQKFQGVSSPDGILRHVGGPFVGSAHDSRMWHESGLSAVLEQLAIAVGRVYCVYGDVAYKLSLWLMKPYEGNFLPNSEEANFNLAMAKVRVSVEWGFGKLTQIWRAENFWMAHGLWQSKCGLGVQYQVMGILCNVHTCTYSCMTAQYFGVDPPTPELYLSGRG
jgi:hypothetical protein